MEERFGKKHPKLEKFKEPLPPFRWLAEAFFRLHRRRQFNESGMLPLTFQELATYADRIAPMHPSMRNLFFRTMEETDNGVMYDAYMKRTEATEQAKRDAEEARRKPRAKRKG